MGYADLHLHSIYSEDGACSIETILAQAQSRQLDVIAITDHNTMDGAIEALMAAHKFHMQVIPAVEISTTEGHLLAYEVYQPIKRGQSLESTVRKVHEAGGFCIVPHPMAIGFDGIRMKVLAQALQDPIIAETIWGIELINGGLNRRNFRAVGLDSQFNLAAVGSSDGHNIDSVGRVVTQFTGSTIQDLKQALQQRTTSARWHQRTFDPLFYAEHLAFRTLRIMGYGMGLREQDQRRIFRPVKWMKK